MATESNVSKFKDDLESLIRKGELLRIKLAFDLSMVSKNDKKELEGIELPDFRDEYERWYSVSMQVVKQVLPDRLADFVKQYKDEKRKETSFLTYGVSDYMIGLKATRGPQTVVDGKAAFPKFEQQLNILKSAQARFESSVFDMLEVLQADLFDDELDAAQELYKKGFIRAAGAVSGVVLERHLAHVCHKHNLRTRKKSPSINDLNQMLKDDGAIDTPMWRFIQRLGDIRNLCDHNKERDPSKEEVDDLISGVRKIISTLF
ncbi:MAG: hypothetical protein M3426_05720 [Actinomycetota bacterium]|nr:hypothetical protein [Actinomycetota bacterium]